MRLCALLDRASIRLPVTGSSDKVSCGLLLVIIMMMIECLPVNTMLGNEHMLVITSIGRLSGRGAGLEMTRGLG